MTNLAISVAEAVELGAVDSVFYSRYFFPKTFRQGSPVFHQDIWQKLEDQSSRYVALSVFRDGAKTTLLRAFSSKMIAYGFCHTILSIGKSESAAKRTSRWLMKQVEVNAPWAQAFQLSPGKKWTEEEFDILHGIEQYPIHVLAFGMTGSIRGVNLDDYRPDLIIVDDPCNTENTATQEQREKTKTLLFTDIKMTLAPRSEAPHAKMVLLQTPLAHDDAIDFCMKDPEWSKASYSILTDQKTSAWEDRYPTTEVLQDKENHILRGQLPLWMREKEVTIISSEMAPFRAENLKYWDTLPGGAVYMLAIDPASSDSKDADDMAVAVVCFYQNDVYLVTYRLYRGYNFDALAADLFQLVRQYPIRNIIVESVAYQRTLMWHLKREMENRRIFLTISPYDDRRKKSDRIIQALGGLSGFGHFYCHASHNEFIQQYITYVPKANPKDDLLDAIAMAVSSANPALAGSEVIEAEFERIALEEKSIPSLMIGGAP